MKIINAVLLSALVMIGGFTSIQSAFADPGFSVSVTPGTLGPGGVFLIDIGISPAEVGDTNAERIFVLYDPDGDSAIGTSFLGCSGYTIPVGETADRIWDLEDFGSDNVGITVPGGTVGSVVDWDFGNGDAATSAGSFAVNPTAVLYDPEDGGTANPPDGALVWNELPGGAADDTFGVGSYVVEVCAYKDADLNGEFTPGENSGTGTVTFQVSMPVGGEILPIDTSALFIAGISSNPMWALSALAVVAGMSFVMLRMQVARKNF